MTRSRLQKTAALFLSLIMIFSVFAPAASADYSWSEDEMVTYYFLAPDNWFKTDAGAYSEQVGAYWWQGENVPDAWPGHTMEPAPEVGENVFKVDNMSLETVTIIFNAFLETNGEEELMPFEHQTHDINTEGYDQDCPYDYFLSTDDFDGWIYVLNMNSDTYNGDNIKYHIYDGAWFTLDDYKNHSDYYGTYDFNADSTDSDKQTVENTTDTSLQDPDTDTSSSNSSRSVMSSMFAGPSYVGDTVTVDFLCGYLQTTNGDPAKLAAYNLELDYNADILEIIPNGDYAAEFFIASPGKNYVTSSETPGKVIIADLAAEGLDADFNEVQTIFRVKFKVKTEEHHSSKLNISFVDQSSTIISLDGSTVEKLPQYHRNMGMNIRIIRADDASSDTDTLTSDIDNTTTDTEKDGDYHIGDTVTADIRIGGLRMSNGSPAKLIAYNYEVNYDTSCLEVIPNGENSAEFLIYSRGKNNIALEGEPGTIRLADADYEGMNGNFTQMQTVARITFKVTAKTTKLGITGECTSLSAVRMNNADTEKLDGSKYTEFIVDVSCPHTAPSTDSELPPMILTDIDKPDGSDSDKTSTDSDTDSSENKHTFFFDTGDWNSDRILFYIWDETAEPTMFASINGWEEENRWGSKKLNGTMVDDGIFESYPVDIPEGHDVFVIFYDPVTGIQTFDCVLTPEAYGDTARLTGTLLENPVDSEKVTNEVAFDKSGLTAKKTITSTGNIVGTTITPNMNGSMEVAKYILNYLGHTDKLGGEEVVTEEKVANAIEAFETTPDDVWSSYQTFADELNYQPEEAKKVIFGSDENSDQDVESDTDSSSTDTDSDNSSNNIPTPKGNNDDKGTVGDVDVDGIVNSGDAVMILRSSVGMDAVLLVIADVDRDGTITAADAVGVLRFSVHIIDNIRIGRKIIS